MFCALHLNTFITNKQKLTKLVRANKTTLLAGATRTFPSVFVTRSRGEIATGTKIFVYFVLSLRQSALTGRK